MKLKAFKIRQGNENIEETRPGVEEYFADIYVTIMRTGDVIEHSVLDRVPRGYQRPPDPRRLKYTTGSPVKYLKSEEALFPTSILLNIRDKDKIGFKPEVKINNVGELGELTIPDDVKLYLIDGQHRVAALEEVIREDPAFMNYPLIVSISALPDPYDNPTFEEMRQFYIVNSRQKRIPTDIAFKLLYDMYNNLGLTKLIEIEGRAKALRGMAMGIADQLKEFPPWKGRVWMPGMEKPLGYAIEQRPLADSISYILRERTFRGMPEEKLVELLVNYWNAIKDLYKEAFDHPEDYTVQATPGIYAFNMVFPTVYAQCMTTGEVSQKGMGEILNRLLDAGVDLKFWSKRETPYTIAVATSMKLIKQLADILEEILTGKKKSIKEIFVR